MKSSAIAIVGLAGRFPGARNIGEFWRNLRDGVEAIQPLSDAELLAAGVPPEIIDQPEYVKAAAVLEGVDRFDASFFGLSPKDAAIMDPQHRHFLECAWEAIEDAGHPPESFSGSIGVFAGSGMNAYMMHNLLNNRGLLESAGLFLIRQTGNDKDVLATRVSYQLDLRGPSLAVQTACSTSLVAVHLACQSLLACECDMALAGGVTIEIPHARGYLYREGEILSRDGHCRAFDAASSGTVFSSGVGIVVLRRLEDALKDLDTIHAVILGTAVNNDGRRKVGYFAPSVAGQAEVIAEALGVAGVNADTVSYVETHGTGTAVGDPLEIKALTQAFRQHTQRKGYCAIGSLKTNVGHLDTAAGVAGLIKVVLAFRHRQLPASLHFHSANPQIEFDNSPFYVNRALADWQVDGNPRRAGVTSLGIGGTNAHVVLEEAPELVRRGTTRPHQLITLSAKTEMSLEEAAAGLATHLRENPALRLADVAFTCQVGRSAFPHRRIAVAGDVAEAAQILSAPETRRGFTGSAVAPAPSSVVFLFPGQGSQYPNMAAGLYASEPIFRACLDRCAEQLLPHLGLDLRGALYAAEQGAGACAKALDRTSITQPTLFAVEYSLAQWWMAHGVRPQAMVGHSIGEYVAACLAGVLSLDDALAITAIRGRLMEQCLPGSMLAVALSREALSRFSLPAGVAIAAENAPQQCVISGRKDAVAELELNLVEKGVICRRLPTSHAFHSSMMEPILAPFLAHFRRISLRPPRIPYLSNLTGTWISAAQATDPEYWTAHLRRTVRFSDSITELLRQPGRVVIEVGPGRALASLVRRQIIDDAGGASAIVLSSLRAREETIPDTLFLLSALGQLWIVGQTIEWSALHAGQEVRRIPLPTYAFQRQRFWIEPDQAAARAAEFRSLASAARPITEREATIAKESTGQEGISQWFYQRSWRRTARPAAVSPAPTCWMIFQDPIGLGEQIARQVKGAAHEVVEVAPGKVYQRRGRGRYMIRPGVREDYDALLADLTKRKLSPRKIVHLWNVGDRSSQLTLEQKIDRSFYSLLFLAQALGDQDLSGIDIAIVSDRMQSVAGESILDPVTATLLGPTRVIPKELPGINCRSIDIDLTSQGRSQLAVQIISEHCIPFSDPAVAIRGGERWIEILERCDLHALTNLGRLRQKGVYMITGGLGDLGLVIAEELARNCKARLVLLGRRPVPPAEEWKDALEAASTPDRIKRQLRKLIEMESLGGEVLTLSTDVCRRDEMKRAIATAVARFGVINGVIHAAGIVEDGPLQLKSREGAARVLGPKVNGTFVLHDVLQEAMGGNDRRLDFCVLFSSVSSVLAPAGQVDYTAANAFLDSFAASRRDAGVVAINWGPWREVGIAARTAAAHPLLGRRLAGAADEVLYALPLRYERHWLLADHCLKGGMAVVPGTGYLEMAFAALTQGSFDQGVEFEDVFFVAPLFAAPGQTREVRVALQPGSNGAFQFSVRTHDGRWIEHASGRIARCKEPLVADRAIDRIRARCQARVLAFDDTHRTEQERYFDFGPRWRCLKAIHLGASEALADLELATAFSEDSSSYRLHPALLDLATASALYLIDNYGPSSSLYFPLAYKRAILYRPLPSKFFSHIRSQARNEAGREVATFDVTLLNEKGRVLGEIEGFSMRLVRDPKNALPLAPAHVSVPAARDDAAEERPPRGIAPADGAKAFTRILSSHAPPGIFVLPDGPIAMSAHAGTALRPPSRKTSFDSVEAVLGTWWQELLGVERVGLDDDFFELGGQSLIVVRLFSKIKKTYGVNFGLSTLFEARTIRTLAQLIREAASTKTQGGPSPGRALVTIQPKGTRLPLYVISGLGGNVIKFHQLAHLLGEDQPVYGLLPRGLDGDEPYHTRVEEMAAYYVEAILKVQVQGPYRLVGYSFGGAVAFEVAHQIVAQGGAVSLLGLFDTIEWQYMEQVGRSLGIRERLAIYRSEFMQAMSRGDSFRPLWKRFKSGIWKTLLRLSYPLDRRPQPEETIEGVNLYAAANYRPKVYPGRLTLFRATMRGPQEGDDAVLGWGDLVAGGIDVHHIPCTHFTILQEPAVRILVEKLRQCLDRDPAVATTIAAPAASLSVRRAAPASDPSEERLKASIVQSNIGSS
jgi:acyl transferase domain-containing protein/thioesterase domain-containing protein